jgi:hypothetical protein
MAKLIEENSIFEDLNPEELNHAKQIIENFICKKIYFTYRKRFLKFLVLSLFPKNKTAKDAQLYQKMKLLEWISYEHLDIDPRNRFDGFWSKCISSM